MFAENDRDYESYGAFRPPTLSASINAPVTCSLTYIHFILNLAKDVGGPFSSGCLKH